jgi:hypothetical protein
MGLAIDYVLCDEFLLVKQMLHHCEKRMLYFESNFLDMEFGVRSHSKNQYFKITFGVLLPYH